MTHSIKLQLMSTATDEFDLLLHYLKGGTRLLMHCITFKYQKLV